jgi:hypothetical protein
MYAQNIIQEKIVAPAMKNEAFRQELLTNPKTLLEHELGITLPHGVTIQVHEDTPTTVHFVLPQRTPSSELWELDAAELERTYAYAAKQTDEPSSACVCRTTNMTYTDITECCCDNQTNSLTAEDRKM